MQFFSVASPRRPHPPNPQRSRSAEEDLECVPVCFCASRETGDCERNRATLLTSYEQSEDYID